MKIDINTGNDASIVSSTMSIKILVAKDNLTKTCQRMLPAEVARENVVP